MPLRPCPGQNTRAVPACLWLSSGRGLQNTKLQKNTTSSPQSRRSLPLRALLRIWCALLGAASPLWGQTPDGQPLRNGLYRDAEGSTSASSLPGAGQGSRVTTAAALGIGSAGVESGSTGAPSADVNTAHSLDDREQRRRSRRGIRLYGLHGGAMEYRFRTNGGVGRTGRPLTTACRRRLPRHQAYCDQS